MGNSNAAPNRTRVGKTAAISALFGRILPRLCAGILLCWLTASTSLAEGQQIAGVFRRVDDRGNLYFSDIPYYTGSATVQITRPPGLSPAPLPSRRPPSNVGYDAVIARVSQRYRVHPALVKAVVAAESNFDPRAVSHKGAQGLMQLMPATARDLGVEDAMEPEQNISGGVRYLRAMLERFGEVDFAVAAYNAGPTAVDRYRGVPPYPETKAYVRRVLNYYRGYHSEFSRQ
jgi:soluble lytic murein transglycosylase-like protein